jgi:hypothetical protein
MDNKGRWVNIALFGLCFLALTGLVLRSKVVFALPFINYNHLLEAHSHFTFGGWVTPALMLLLVTEVLPRDQIRKPIYPWLLAGIVACAWAMLVTYILAGYSVASIIASAGFIFFTYAFGWVFIRDVLRARLSAPVPLLAVCSMLCLILSSVGTIIIAYIFFTKSFDAILYRDALFTYLHFQYNGFFTLAVFSILFSYLRVGQTLQTKSSSYWFSVLLCISVIPSLFLSYLWQDPEKLYWIIAVGGSLLLLWTLCWFILTALSLRSVFTAERPVIKALVLLSMGSFALKIFLQGFTIFPSIGNAIFGNRPVIMGFLHLVFLAFVSLFILAWLTKRGMLDGNRKITRFALVSFAGAVLCNELLLLTQGLTTMFFPGSSLFPWLLWITGIWLFASALLIAIARKKTKTVP